MTDTAPAYLMPDDLLDPASTNTRNTTFLPGHLGLEVTRLTREGAEGGAAVGGEGVAHDWRRLRGAVQRGWISYSDRASRNLLRALRAHSF